MKMNNKQRQFNFMRKEKLYHKFVLAIIKEILKLFKESPGHFRLFKKNSPFLCSHTSQRSMP